MAKKTADPHARPTPQQRAVTARQAALKDDVAELTRQRDELNERLLAAESKECPSCGAETRKGKMRPAKPESAAESESATQSEAPAKPGSVAEEEPDGPLGVF